MKSLVTCILVAISVAAQSQNVTEVDICIYGGTSAGVIAAYTAKYAGKSVLLIEPGKHLGGLTTGGLGYTDIGNKYAVSGLARDFYRRIGQHYGKFEQWIFEPHIAEELFNEYIKRANVNVIYNCRIVSAQKDSAAFIKQIVIENPAQPDATRIIRAKMFIDCTYEGDLMALAGVSYIVGREDASQYSESFNGVQVREQHQFPDGIDPYKIPGKPESGLLWGISPEILPPTGTGDKRVQAYNFRICLTDDPANLVPITRPDQYDSAKYELLIRLFTKEPDRPFNRILKPDMMPNHKTDINNNGPFSTDMIGMNYDYPEASYDRRKEIIKEHELYTKGLLYFLGHSPRIPKHIRTEMLRWGYPKDEYTDNGNWSHQPYIREARRMIGAYVMTQSNCMGKLTVPDGVGMAAYTMDSHNTSRVVINGMVKNEGDVQIGGFPPYPISYRALVPKPKECRNLLVPVCLSASHIAYGSIRMEPVFMVLAQSSAEAASQAIDKNVGIQDIDVQLLRQKLKDNPLADGSPAEILVDNDDANGVMITGNWSKEKGGYGPSMLKLTADKNTKLQSVQFQPALSTSRQYEVYAYFPRVENTSADINVVIHAGRKEQAIIIHPNSVKIEGQTSGEWISLGIHSFHATEKNAVAITSQGADGVVVADAVLFIPR